MTDVTLKSLAVEIQTPVDRLVQQFADAGIDKTAIDYVTQQEKETLLAHLNRNHSTALHKLILQRKKRSTLNITSTGGKSKSIQVEVRKKRTYLQRNLQTIKHSEMKDQIEKKTVEGVKHNIEEKTKQVITEINKLTNQQANIIKPLQTTEKACRKAKTEEMRRKSEEEAFRKIEEKAYQIAEEARRMAEENSGTWITTPELVDEDIIDYHVTTSYHAQEAEDDNDRKVESNRRSRGEKTTKQKKIYRFESKTDREEVRAVGRSGKNKRKSSILMQSFNKPVQAINRDVVIGETITVAELANKMAVKSSHVIKTMMKMGTMTTINQVIDQETAQLVAEEMGHKVILCRESELEESVIFDSNTGNLDIAKPCAPVVTIMGHVDHGKTSLLDYIRSTKVADSEAGGITQHIGAYHVKTDKGMITFLDTPGHSAFTAMRARGAQSTDIVVLVVAADDGVMPQTIEAIQHAKAAMVPVVVAINKIDKLEADPDRIKHELIQHGIIPEEWGGESQCVHVSAKSGIGIDDLLDSILLQAEMLELKAIHNKAANGIVIESFLDKGRGPVATILIREGTLHCGDIVLCGFEYGRVRALRNEMGHNITSAGPSLPVEVLGLSGVPVAGDRATVVSNEKKAREVALYRQGKLRDVKLAYHQTSKLENMFANMIVGEISELNIVLKSDVQGSNEAIIDVLKNLSTNEVKITIIGSGVGAITETDATLALASNAILIGFNVRANTSARRIIEAENINLYYYSVIYNLINEVQQAVRGMLIPKYKQEIIGLAEVRNVFRSPKFGAIAGCMVIKGTVKRYNKIRVLRNNIVVYNGELESLRRFKDDVNEVSNSMECGIGVKNYNDVCSGDIIEVFEDIEIQRTIT